MAATQVSKYITLYDKWPEPPVTEHVLPPNALSPGGIVSADAGHNRDAALFPPMFLHGTKARIWAKTEGGLWEWVTFIYLSLGTQAGTLAALGLLGPEDTDATKTIYQVSNAGAAAPASGLIAVALSAMTNGRSGWFWCGGRAPTVLVPALIGNFITTAAAISVGSIGAISDGGSPAKIVMIKQAAGMEAFAATVVASTG